MAGRQYGHAEARTSTQVTAMPIKCGLRYFGLSAHRASEGAEVEASGSAILSVTDSCRDAAVITQGDVSGHDSLVNIAHSRRFKATTN
jgi:hypothetical protein